MIGIIFCGTFVLLAVMALLGGIHADPWELLAYFGIASLWYIGFQLSAIWSKLKEIKEGLYASFYMQNKEEINADRN